MPYLIDKADMPITSACTCWVKLPNKSTNLEAECKFKFKPDTLRHYLLGQKQLGKMLLPTTPKLNETALSTSTGKSVAEEENFAKRRFLEWMVIVTTGHK